MSHYYSDYDEELRVKRQKALVKEQTEKFEKSIKERGVAATFAYLKMGWL